MRDETKIYAKPAEGRDVPLSDGTAWPAEGDWIDLQDRYYRRRLDDGDIVKTKPPAEPKSPEPAAASDEAPGAAADAGAADGTGGEEQSASGRRKPR